MKIRHFLYNCFLIETETCKIAIDPGQNLGLFNLTSLIPRDDWPDITHIFVTHGDPDHYWHADRVAQASGAPVICGEQLTRMIGGELHLVDPRGRELTSWVKFEQVYPLAVGDRLELGPVRVEAVKSVHGPIVFPVLGFKIRKTPGPDERVGLGSIGFKIEVGGKSLLNLGDSLLLPDWQGLAPDVLMLPIGGLGQGTWTMDLGEALQAVAQIEPRIVIPCHYSVPALWYRNFAPADGARFKTEIEKTGIECRLLRRGDEIEL